ncbi:hypothetical protein D3C75_441280 [compost metagenome]
MLTDMAGELGFSLSSFQHYCVMLYADRRGNTTSISNLISEMLKDMQKVKIGDMFIVSDLLPDIWLTFTRNVKMTLAKQLANKVRNDSKFDIYLAAKGKTTIL